MFVRSSNIILKGQDSLDDSPAPPIQPLNSRTPGLVIELTKDQSNSINARHSLPVVKPLGSHFAITDCSSLSKLSEKDHAELEYSRQTCSTVDTHCLDQTTGKIEQKLLEQNLSESEIAKDDTIKYGSRGAGSLCFTPRSHSTLCQRQEYLRSTPMTTVQKHKLGRFEADSKGNVAVSIASKFCLSLPHTFSFHFRYPWN
jgi:hypothetical protein